MVSKASLDNIFSTSWRKASDRGDPARYVGNDIRVRAWGGVESLKGMRYPSLRTDSTQDSAPIVCQCLQCTDRQPPTCNRGKTPSGGLFTGTLSFATGAAGATGGPRKGRLALRPSFFRPCWAEEEEGAVDACFCDRGTTEEAPTRSAEEADEDPALDGPAEDGGCNVR